MQSSSREKTKRRIFSIWLTAIMLLSIIQPILLAPPSVSANTETEYGVFSFGFGEYGRLGHGDDKNQLEPKKIKDLSEVKTIAAGDWHTLILTEDGEVYSFGAGSNGKLGHGNTENQLAPKKIAGLSNVKALSARTNHSLVLTENGDVYSFGRGNNGSLGHGDENNQLEPKKIEDLPSVIAISTGSNHSLVLTVTGDVYSFGRGHKGQLGHGDENNRLVPKKIEQDSEGAPLPVVKAIATGEYHSLVLTEDGEVYSFGDGAEGRLGHGDENNQPAPKKIAGLSNVKAISGGAFHSLVLTEEGDVYSFGYYGALGHGNSITQLEPKKIEALSNVKAISAGGDHSLVLTVAGEVYSFGYGGYGQLGHGDNKSLREPKKIEALSNVKAIAAGSVTSFVIAPLRLPTIDPIAITYDKAEEKDIIVKIDFGDYPLQSITNGEEALVVDEHFTRTDGQVKIKREYLLTQPVGTTTLTFNFSEGKTQEVAIEISNTAPANLTELLVDGVALAGFSPDNQEYRVTVPYSTTSVTITPITSSAGATVDVQGGTDLEVGDNIVTVTVTAENGDTKVYTIVVTVTSAEAKQSSITPTSATFDKEVDNQTDIAVNIAWNGNTLISIADGEGLLTLGEEYFVDGSTVTITKEYLQTQPEGTTVLTFTFSEGANRNLKITISDSTPVDDIPDEDVTWEDDVTWDDDDYSSNDGGSSSGGSTPENEEQSPSDEVIEEESPESAPIEEEEETASIEDEEEETPLIEVTFSDTAGHWAERQIQLAAQLGIVTGYQDGTFKPYENVTRQEFLLMLMNALKPAEDGVELSFSDQGMIGEWAKDAIAQAIALGIVTGYEDGSFRPNANITRAEMAVMVARALGLDSIGAEATDFADDADIPVWAKRAVSAVKESGIISGRGNNQFVPNSTANRAEAITMIMNLLELN